MPTTDQIFELQTSIINTLAADATLLSIVNGIYNNVPIDAKVPYIAIDTISTNNTSSKSANNWDITISIKAYSQTRDSKEASNIIAEVRRIISSTTLIPIGGNVVFVSEISSQINRFKDGISWTSSILYKIALSNGSGFIGDGNKFTIKIGDGSSPSENFSVIEGLKVSGFKISNRIIDSNVLGGSRWQKLANGGIANFMIEASGLFSNTSAEQVLETAAFSGIIKNYQILFGNNNSITAPFLVSEYNRNGNIAEYEQVRFVLTSAGEVVGGHPGI